MLLGSSEAISCKSDSPLRMIYNLYVLFMLCLKSVNQKILYCKKTFARSIADFKVHMQF